MRKVEFTWNFRNYQMHFQMHMKCIKPSCWVDGIKELRLHFAIFPPQLCDWNQLPWKQEIQGVTVLVGVILPVIYLEVFDWCFCCQIETWFVVSGLVWLPTILFINVNVTFSNCFSFAAIITALLITWIFHSQAHYGPSIFPSFPGTLSVTLGLTLFPSHLHTHTHADKNLARFSYLMHDLLTTPCYASHF